MASAAITCSETIERTRVTRLSHCVAQAIRELVDQVVEAAPVMVLNQDSEPMPLMLITDSVRVLLADQLSPWILSLPPPAIA